MPKIAGLIDAKTRSQQSALESIRPLCDSLVQCDASTIQTLFRAVFAQVYLLLGAVSIPLSLTILGEYKCAKQHYYMLFHSVFAQFSQLPVSYNTYVCDAVCS